MQLNTILRLNKDIGGFDFFHLNARLAITKGKLWITLIARKSPKKFGNCLFEGMIILFG